MAGEHGFDRPQYEYGDARDLSRFLKEHPGEDFWVIEVDGPAPLMFGIGDAPDDEDEALNGIDYDYSDPLDEAGDELGDKLALALEMRPVSSAVRIGGRSRPLWRQLWLRLLPGRHCRDCGNRLHRTDPQGQPTRVWWCPEHGPRENPNFGNWNSESRVFRD